MSFISNQNRQMPARKEVNPCGQKPGNHPYEHSATADSRYDHDGTTVNLSESLEHSLYQWRKDSIMIYLLLLSIMVTNIITLTWLALLVMYPVEKSSIENQDLQNQPSFSMDDKQRAEDKTVAAPLLERLIETVAMVVAAPFWTLWTCSAMATLAIDPPILRLAGYYDSKRIQIMAIQAAVSAFSGGWVFYFWEFSTAVCTSTALLPILLWIMNARRA